MHLVILLLIAEMLYMHSISHSSWWMFLKKILSSASREMVTAPMANSAHPASSRSPAAAQAPLALTLGEERRRQGVREGRTKFCHGKDRKPWQGKNNPKYWRAIIRRKRELYNEKSNPVMERHVLVYRKYNSGL